MATPRRKCTSSSLASWRCIPFASRRGWGRLLDGGGSRTPGRDFMTYPTGYGPFGAAWPRRAPSTPRSSMKLASALFLASAATVLSLGDATANDADRRSLYAAANVVDFLSR